MVCRWQGGIELKDVRECGGRAIGGDCGTCLVWVCHGEGGS